MMPFGEAVQVVAACQNVEAEYASMRKAAGLLDAPHRGLVEVTGADRVEYLQRMISTDCTALGAGTGAKAFLLNEKGRITADMAVLEAGDRTLLDLDAHEAETTRHELDKFLFTEDVHLTDRTGEMHRFSCHGPSAAHLVGAATGADLTDLGPYDHRVVWAGDTPVRVFREDETGEVGIHLWGAADAAAALWDRLHDAGTDQGLKAIGWLAFNMARVEGGRPMFHVDYGPNSLPHETGVLQEAVNLTKGCYRGQEVVARMESLGHPAKLLVGFRAEATALPVAGAPVLDGEGAEANTIGAVTSSTYAPMLSDAGVGFAVVKWGYHETGTRLYSPAEGTNTPIVVQPMKFYAGRAA